MGSLDLLGAKLAGGSPPVSVRLWSAFLGREVWVASDLAEAERIRADLRAATEGDGEVALTGGAEGYRAGGVLPAGQPVLVAADVVRLGRFPEMQRQAALVALCVLGGRLVSAADIEAALQAARADGP